MNLGRSFVGFLVLSLMAGASTLRRATSRGGAAPTSRAWYSLGSLWNFTVIRSAPSTTW